MSAIKNVVLNGASGSVGIAILEQLIASGKFNIKLLRRQGSSSTFPAGANVVDVDFESVDSIKAALEGQDAVVSAVGSLAIQSQKTLIDAAVSAGIKRFIPSDFGSDMDNPKTRKLPVFTTKVQIQDYLIEKVKGTDTSYTFVYNSAFLDWGLQHGFILKTADYKPLIIDGGNYIFSTTSLETVGKAVVGVLTHLPETKNRTVRVEDLKVSQNQLLALAKQIAPEKPWELQHAKLDDMTAKADERVAKGIFDMETFGPYLFRAVLDPEFGGNFTKTDNELLGLKGKTEKDVADILKALLK